MREPSLHIKESDLIRILEDADLKGVNIKQLVKYILKTGKKHTLNHRKLLAANKKVTQKAEKVLSSSSEDTLIMNSVILMLRRKLKHQNVQLIRPGTKEYTVLKTITSNARSFYDNYFEPDESIKNAFVKYIEIGISKMQKFTITKLNSLHEAICLTFEANKRIALNPQPELTDRALKWYNKWVLDRVGTILTDYSKIPDKYVCFIQVAEYCKENRIEPEVYIDAQFKGVEWRQGIPDPHQLIGDKALTYLQNHLFQNPELVKKVKTEDTKLKNKLKELGKW